MQPPDWIDRAAAIALLGVKPATLYTYVSRGLIQRTRRGRTSQYRREDVVRLAGRRDARAGHAAVANLALSWGPPVIDSAITRLDPTGIHYRERPLETLLGRPFEAVAELLWTGALPTEPPIWPAADGLRVEGDRPLDRMRRAIAALPSPPLGLGAPRVMALGRRLGASLAAALAPGPTSGPLATRIAAAFDAPPALVDRALVASADHGLNASTFTARIVASTGADLHACVTAALAAISGPRHGGAAERIEALLAAPDPAAAALARLQRGEGVPGFGHPLYATADPRTGPLLEAARAARPEALGSMDALIEAMRAAGHPAPTVDLGLVAVARAMGAPAGTATALFALGRLAGWVAHVIEQQRSPDLLRPRARYVG